MAGCMRGTIAYALILRAVPPVDEQSHVDTIMVTTVFPGGRWSGWLKVVDRSSTLPWNHWQEISTWTLMVGWKMMFDVVVFF